jgi:hypothetical protein
MDHFISNSAQFVQTGKAIGINIFPAQYRALQLRACHRCLCATPDTIRSEADFLRANRSFDTRWKHFHSLKMPYTT